MKIFLNPGHCCGIDCGAVNDSYDVTEADIVAEIGTLVQAYLEDYDIEVILEQSDNLAGEDSYSYYDSVCYNANKAEADYFISLHCNAFNGNANGTECFAMPNGEGWKLAASIHDEIVRELDTTPRGVKNGDHLIVIKNTAMPAVLVEIAFIDNEDDCRQLIFKKNEIARAITRGIVFYLEEGGYE